MCVVVLRPRWASVVVSGRSVDLTRLFMDRLWPSCTFFRRWLTTALLELMEGETKVCGRTGYRTRDLWLLSQTRYRLRYAVRQCVCVCGGGVPIQSCLRWEILLWKIIAIFQGAKSITCTGKSFHTFLVAKQTFIPTYFLGWIPGLATYFRFSFRYCEGDGCQLLARVCARSTG